MEGKEDGRIVEEKIEEGRDGEKGIEEGREETPLLQSENFEKILDAKIEEIKAKVKEAVNEAIANTLGELLEEKEEGELSRKEIETEEVPKCPKNISWLKKMFEILPLDILRESKLWKYRHCVMALKEAEKEAEQ